MTGFNHPLPCASATRLLHSIWQGAAITATAGAILWMLRRKTSATRYLVSAAAMFSLVMLPLITFVFLNPSSATPSPPPPALLLQMAAPAPQCSNGQWCEQSPRCLCISRQSRSSE